LASGGSLRGGGAYDFSGVDGSASLLRGVGVPALGTVSVLFAAEGGSDGCGLVWL
jgi:hypothetical protein